MLAIVAAGASTLLSSIPSVLASSKLHSKAAQVSPFKRDWMVAVQSKEPLMEFWVQISWRTCISSIHCCGEPSCSSCCLQAGQHVRWWLWTCSCCWRLWWESPGQAGERVGAGRCYLFLYISWRRNISSQASWFFVGSYVDISDQLREESNLCL